MSRDNIDHGRRKALTGGVAIVGSIGTAVAIWPFASSMNPSASALAAVVPVEVDVSKMQPGQLIQDVYRRKPIWIIRRTPEMIKTLSRLTSKLRDPNSKVKQQPAFAQNEYRSINEEFLVLYGVCTHLGCNPEFKPDPGIEFLGGRSWLGGFYCACHGSKFDLAGRVYKNVPANKNLEVPPYHFLSENRILIGLTKKEASA